MKKILFIVVAMVALQMGFVSCQQGGKSSESTEKNDTTENKGVYTEYQYKFYQNSIGVGEGLAFCGFVKDVYKDGSIEYCPYMNFVKNYNNTSTLDGLILKESDLPLMLEFIDSCSSYTQNTANDSQKLIRCKFGDKDNCCAFVYGGNDESMGVFFKVNRYALHMSLTDFRNIVSGLKVKLESLKKEDAAKKSKK